MSNKNKAIILMLLSSLTAALVAAAIKEAGSLPFYEKSFFRNIVTVVTAGFIILRSNDSFFGRKGNRRFLFFRALCGTLGVWCSYYAISHMLLADATVLGKLSPFFVILFSFIFLKEKIKKYHIIAMVVAFIGVLFIVKPSSGYHMNIYVAIIAIASGVFGGGVATFLRFLRRKEKSNTIVFFYAFTSCMLSIPLMIYNFDLPTWHQLISLILAGALSSCTQFALTIAYKYAPASEISIFGYSNVVFVTFIGFIIWNNIPDEYSLLGYAFIVIASIFMFVFNNKKSKVAV